MDMHSQLKEILHTIEALKSQMHDTQEGLRDDFRSIHKSLVSMKEKCTLMNIMNEYHQEVYSWYALEDDCDDWYMDSCHF
jgi:hypothetical protein